MFNPFQGRRDHPRDRLDPSFSEAPVLPASPPTVMLPLIQPFSPDKDRLFQALCSRYRKADGTEPLVTVSAAPGMVALVSFAGVKVAVLISEKPLPNAWREIAAPARSLHWPDAMRVCSHHTAHLIFGLIGQQSDDMRALRVLTGVAGAVAALYPDQVLAGLWGADVLNAGEVWARQSGLSFAPYPNLPVGLWVSQHPFADEKNGGVGVLTQGLTRFVGRELELVAPYSDLKRLLERSVGLTNYLVQNGPVLKDGSTFGVSDTERIDVTLRTSIRFAGRLVIAASLSVM